jgi:hypothetical protein
VLDAGAYARLTEAVERAETLAGIRRGLDEFARGKGRPARATLEQARRAFLRKSRSSAA